MLPAGSYNIICSESRHRNRKPAKNSREDAEATRKYHNRFRWVAKKLLPHFRMRNGKTKISKACMIETRPSFPYENTKEALICCGDVSTIFCCSNATCVFCSRNKVPLRRFSCLQAILKSQLPLCLGPKKCWEASIHTVALSKKITWYQREDCCLVITLVAKKKMKVSDIYWGTSV